MDAILHQILKDQNHDLLCRLADKLNLDRQYVLQKYWTPSFYLLGRDTSAVYEIQEQLGMQRKTNNAMKE
jgi:1,2-phenylacetyl-CoA epoxidase catalytic subunit